MLEKIKLALRIKTAAFDIEIADIIAAAKEDLIFSGLLVVKVTDSDVLIIRAVVLYVKSHFGLDNTDSEKYQLAYDSLKTHLALSRDYTGYKVAFAITVLTLPVSGALILVNGETIVTNSLGQAIYYHYKDNTDIAYRVTYENYLNEGITLINSDQTITVNME